MYLRRLFPLLVKLSFRFHWNEVCIFSTLRLLDAHLDACSAVAFVLQFSFSSLACVCSRHLVILAFTSVDLLSTSASAKQ